MPKVLEEVYLDNAATTPMHPSVIEAVTHAMQVEYGNPSSRHAKGQAAKHLLESSRALIAKAINAYPDEIYFTSGGTESNNLAITGSCAAYERKYGPGTIITTTLEHPSVTKTVRGLKRSGWEVIYLDAKGGNLDLDGLKKALQERSGICLISTACVQSELGYRFPVEEVAGVVKSQVGSAQVYHAQTGPMTPLVHSDAVQAFGKYIIDVQKLGVDMLSFCSHKIGGPKGIGALYVRRGVELFTTAFGGGQEQGLRSGTEALPQIVGFAEAVRIAQVKQYTQGKGAQTEQTTKIVQLNPIRANCGRQPLLSEWAKSGYLHQFACELRDYLLAELQDRYPNIVINSRADGSPFVTNFTLPGTNNIEVLDHLSSRGVFLSATMACSSNHLTVPPGTWRKKHPLALVLAGVPAHFIHSTYRVSFSDRTNKDDVLHFLQALEEVVPVKHTSAVVVK